MTVEQIFGMDQSVISEANLEIGMGGMLEGVCLGYANECRVEGVPAGDRAVRVLSGLVSVGGVFVAEGFMTVLTADVGDALPRVDRVVVRRDNNTNTVWIGFKKGTPAANPQPPPLTRSGGVYEISLAQVRIAAGLVGPILDNNITDERGSPAVCGYISFKAYNQVQRAAVEGWRQRGSWSAMASNATVAAEGIYSGLFTVENTCAAIQGVDGVAFQQNTAAALDSDAYVTCNGGAGHGRSYYPVFECKFKLAETTEERVMIGLCSFLIAPVSDDPVGQYAILQYSTSRVDANFMFATKDGVTQNLINSGVPVDTTAHILRILMDSSSVIFELMDTFRNIQARMRTIANLPLLLGTYLTPTSGLRTLANPGAKTIYQYYAEGTNRNI